MKRLVGIAAASAALLFLAQPGWSATGALGDWIMENGKVTLRIIPCGGSLCADIIAMKKPLDHQGNPKLDFKNPNPSLRKRPLIGLRVLQDMKPQGADSWAGSIYNADDGHTYSSNMRLDGDTMKVKGCVAAIFCKKLVFKRVN